MPALDEVSAARDSTQARAHREGEARTPMAEQRWKVVFWAGGRGSRLAELTEVVPKPMVRIGERPILWHIMKHFARAGTSEFVLALGYKGYVIKEFFLQVPAAQRVADG